MVLRSSFLRRICQAVKETHPGGLVAPQNEGSYGLSERAAFLDYTDLEVPFTDSVWYGYYYLTVVRFARGFGLAREGARVAIADIDRPMMARTVREISTNGGDARSFYCDVRRPREIKSMVAQVIRLFGQIDILMHIAGVIKVAAFAKTDEKLWDWMLDTNLKGAFLVARAVVL